MKSGCFKLIAMLIAGVAVILGFTACEATTPAARAQQNPAAFESIPAKDRELVLKSTIAEGMSKDAVVIAWGKPDRVTTGSLNGKMVETWIYTSMRPIYRPYYGLGVGIGGYGYRHHGIYPGASFGMGPDYVPVTSSVVRFRNNHVIAWETADVR